MSSSPLPPLPGLPGQPEAAKVVSFGDTTPRASPPRLQERVRPDPLLGEPVVQAMETSRAPSEGKKKGLFQFLKKKVQRLRGTVLELQLQLGSVLQEVESLVADGARAGPLPPGGLPPQAPPFFFSSCGSSS